MTRSNLLILFLRHPFLGRERIVTSALLGRMPSSKPFCSCLEIICENSKSGLHNTEGEAAFRLEKSW